MTATMHMPATLERPTRVEFRAPLGQRIFARILWCVGSLTAMAIGGVLLWALVIRPIWPQDPPWWSFCLLLVFVLFLPVLLLQISSTQTPNRMILTDDGIWLGASIFGSTRRYEDVRLVKLEKPEKTLGKAVQLTLDFDRGKKRSIWLTLSDAQESFEALRGLCDHAPGIDLEETAYAPENEAYYDAGRVTLVHEFRRKARRQLLASVFFGIVGFGAIVALVIGGAAAYSRPKLWISAIIGPLAAIAYASSSATNRKRAREMERPLTIVKS